MQCKGWEVFVESENAVESVSISTAHYSEDLITTFCQRHSHHQPPPATSHVTWAVADTFDAAIAAGTTVGNVISNKLFVFF